MLLPEDVLAAMLPEEHSWELSFMKFLRDEGVPLTGDDVMPSGYSIISQIFNQSPVGIIVLGPDDRVALINRTAAQLFEYDRDERPDITWRELRESKIISGADEAPVKEEADPLYMALRQKRRTTSNIMLKDRTTDSEDWMTVTAFPVYSDQAKETVAAGVACFVDITDYKGMQEIMYHQATHDPLTGLSNKALLSASMGKAFARARRGQSGGAVLFIDVDKFKRVNDALGHAAGDDLLARIAERLCSEVRETDVVSRVGGDEFAILLADIEKSDDLKVAGEVAERMCRSVAKPFVIWGNEVYVTISIGISLYPPHGLDEETLIAKADAAMFKVKESGRNNWRFWSDDDQD